MAISTNYYDGMLDRMDEAIQDHDVEWQEEITKKFINEIAEDLASLQEQIEMLLEYQKGSEKLREVKASLLEQEIKVKDLNR